MKQSNSYDYPLLAINGAIFFLIYIVQYTDGIIKITDTVPQLMLPIVVFCGMYWDDRVGAVFGFILGSCVDAVGANTICYNSIMLMLLGYLSGVLVTKIINNNFRASIIMSFGSGLIYYFGLWCVGGFNPQYISHTYLKMVLLTVVSAVPIYWGMKLIIYLRKKYLQSN